MSTQILEDYVTHVEAKRELAAELKELEKEIKVYEARVLEYLGEANLQNVKLKSGYTVYQKTDVYASCSVDKDSEVNRMNKEHFMAACEEHDDASFLVGKNINHNQLSAWAREWLEEGGLPEWAEPMLKISEIQRAGVRKGS